MGSQIAEKLHLPQVSYVGEIRQEASTLPAERIEKLGTVMINRQPHPVDRDLKMPRPAFELEAGDIHTEVTESIKTAK